MAALSVSTTPRHAVAVLMAGPVDSVVPVVASVVCNNYYAIR